MSTMRSPTSSRVQTNAGMNCDELTGQERFISLLVLQWMRIQFKGVDVYKSCVNYS